MASGRARDREADQHIRAHQGLRQGSRRRLGCELHLLLVRVPRTAAVDHALAVAEDDVLSAHAELEVEPQATESGGAGARQDELHLRDALAGDFEGVDERRTRDDRRAVLVVVKDGDVHLGLEAALDLEALGGLDVLEVDAAEGRLEELDGADELFRILGCDLDVEDVDAGETLEEDSLALHDRLSGQRPDVAQSEHGGTVGDDRDEVAFGGVLVGEVRVLGDFEAGFGDARGVGQ